MSMKTNQMKVLLMKSIRNKVKETIQMKMVMKKKKKSLIIQVTIILS